MTRQEDKALRQQRNRQEYARRREQKRAYARQYYRDVVEGRRKPRHRDIVEPQERPPSTSALEAMLPPLMRRDLPAIRDEYRRKHISERMLWPYDYFLRMKVIEHFRWRKQMFGSDAVATY